MEPGGGFEEGFPNLRTKLRLWMADQRVENSLDFLKCKNVRLDDDTRASITRPSKFRSGAEHDTDFHVIGYCEPGSK